MVPLADSIKPIAITSGDPGGIGPDLCLDILNSRYPSSLTVLGDKAVLIKRADMLGIKFNAADYSPAQCVRRAVLHSPAQCKKVGALSPANAEHALWQLRRAAEGCLSGEFSAMLTAPVSKQTICEGGFAFRGQTDFLADLAAAPCPVMLLAGKTMRVAVQTRHLPLSQVAAAINKKNIVETLRVLDSSLRRFFNMESPRIVVAGLNPHAGEGGHLGDEEKNIIAPAVAAAVAEGINAAGPESADSMFRFAAADCFLAMFHDQGLPVIKTMEFDSAVNLTLGLPFLRASPDHGTAAPLAGTGRASAKSMRAALDLLLQAAGK